MAHNQVLEGVQGRISQRLDADLRGDAENRKAQAEGLHKIIWNPDATDEQRERAQNALDKLYPHSKDLLGKVRDVSAKVFGYLKAPPGVQETGQAKSEELLKQASNKDAAIGAPAVNPIDPEVANTYVGMTPGLAPSMPPPPGMAGDPGAGASPAPVTMPTPAVAGPASQPVQAAATLPPPPSTAQDIGDITRRGMARTQAEKVAEEQRVANTARTTAQIADDRKQRGAMELQTAGDTAQADREKAAREGAYHEPFSAVAPGSFILNQSTGKFEQLPPGAPKPDSALDERELAMIASDPSNPARQKMAQEAIDRLNSMYKAQHPPSQTSILLNNLREIQLDEKTAVSPGQVINAATKRPVNLAPTESVLLKDMKFLTNQTKHVEELLKTAGDTGAIKGWVTVQGMTLPVVQDVLVNADQAELAAEIGRLNNAYVYAMSGKQINENEAVRLALTSPNIKYTPEINQRMVSGFSRATRAAVAGYMEVNGWAFAPGGTADTIGTGNSNAGTGAGANAGTLTPPPKAGAAPAPGAAPATQFKDGDTFNFNGRDMIRKGGKWVPR